jgi:hypothetical protein
MRKDVDARDSALRAGPGMTNHSVASTRTRRSAVGQLRAWARRSS